MSKAKQEDFMLMLNDKIDRILERLGDVDTRTKLMEEKLACVSDRLSTVESKLSTIEEKPENAIEQATAIRVENGSLEVRLKKIEHEMQKSQDMIDDLQGRLHRNTLILKAFLRMQKVKMEIEEMSSIWWFSFVSINWALMKTKSR